MSTASREQVRGSFYRAKDGALLGVCRGIANYSGISVVWVRLAAFVLAVVTGVWPALLVYFIAAFVMKPAPALAPESDADWEFYNSMSSDRGQALARLKRKFDDVERRTRRIEHIVTSRGYDWDQRLKSGV